MKKRLHALDGMRGVAALMVGIFHYRTAYAPHAYLAVDFFFALSGYVLCRTYRDRLSAGLSTARFTEMRVVRLYPLMFAGILLAGLRAAQGVIRSADMHLDWSTVVGGTLLGLVMLPYPFSVKMYPTNNVFWSIAAELLVNILFAALLFRMSKTGLGLLVLGFAIALCFLGGSPPYGAAGVEWAEWPMFVTRTMFSFPLGILFALLIEPEGGESYGTVLLPIILALVMMADVANTRIYDPLIAILVLPVLLALGARFEMPALLVPLAAFLGDISYAFYALHAPIAHSMRALEERGYLPPVIALPLFLATGILVSVAAVRFWDTPVRRWLNRQLALRRSAPAQLL